MARTSLENVTYRPVPRHIAAPLVGGMPSRTEISGTAIARHATSIETNAIVEEGSPAPMDFQVGDVVYERKAVLSSRRAIRASSLDQPLIDGEILPVAGGIEVIHVPGHCAGQVALMWHPGRMLFAADVCMNLMGLADPVGFENLEEGRTSQRKLASLSFNAAGVWPRQAYRPRCVRAVPQ